MFALRHKETGNLCGFYARGNDGDFCSDVAFELTVGGDNIWVVEDREVAETAAVTTTEWYNADFETPANEYIGELEVVELGVK